MVTSSVYLEVLCSVTDFEDLRGLSGKQLEAQRTLSGTLWPELSPRGGEQCGRCGAHTDLCTPAGSA